MSTRFVNRAISRVLCLIAIPQATYIRLIYSTLDNPPTSCIRAVEGTATYQVIGWSSKIIHIGFLMPMTLINLSSLIVIIIVLVVARGKAHSFDPTETRSLLAANTEESHRPKDWNDQVSYLSVPKVCDGFVLHA